MANFQILAIFFFFKLNLKQLYLFLLVLRFLRFFFLYTHENSGYSEFQYEYISIFLVFRWTLRACSLILFNPSNYKNFKKLKKTLNNNNSCNNNFKYCFNKLYYDCKHWIVLIIVECRHGLVQSATLV